MAYLNENYLKLQAGYLFPEIARRVREFCERIRRRRSDLIRCGIGDVTEPLPPAIIAAMHQAVDELGVAKHFAATVTSRVIEFLREKPSRKSDYRDRGMRDRGR